MTKGYIYRYKCSFKGKHPFVFIKYIDEERFIGCMLTHTKHSKRFLQNESMKPEHFIESTSQFLDCKNPVTYSNSNIVRVFLIKKTNDIIDTPCGGLTDTGITFLESIIDREKIADCESKDQWPEFEYIENND